MKITNDKSYTFKEIDIIRILERYLYTEHGIPANDIRSFQGTSNIEIIVTLQTTTTEMTVYSQDFKEGH